MFKILFFSLPVICLIILNVVVFLNWKQKKFEKQDEAIRQARFVLDQFSSRSRKRRENNINFIVAIFYTCLFFYSIFVGCIYNEYAHSRISLATILYISFSFFGGWLLLIVFFAVREFRIFKEIFLSDLREYKNFCDSWERNIKEWRKDSLNSPEDLEKYFREASQLPLFKRESQGLLKMNSFCFSFRGFFDLRNRYVDSKDSKNYFRIFITVQLPGEVSEKEREVHFLISDWRVFPEGLISLAKDCYNKTMAEKQEKNEADEEEREKRKKEKEEWWEKFREEVVS